MKLNNLEVLQAHEALTELGKRDDFPFKASLDIAIISNMIDIQAKTYGTALQNLYKKYSVKAEPNEGGGVRFVCTAKGETEEATAKLVTENLESFSGKLNELLEETGKDLDFQKIKLPADIKIKAELLKPLAEFVEVG